MPIAAGQEVHGMKSDRLLLYSIVWVRVRDLARFNQGSPLQILVMQWGQAHNHRWSHTFFCIKEIDTKVHNSAVALIILNY